MRNQGLPDAGINHVYLLEHAVPVRRRRPQGGIAGASLIVDALWSVVGFNF
jgi:hypothetical protein